MPLRMRPGGSSSGSAVAVAAGLVPMALGTDTGGSVRVPAALCGIVGLKTTIGRVSRAGVYPLCWTLDSVGPITRSVEDAAIVYQAMQGGDARDKSTAGVVAHDTLRGLKDGVRGLRLAFGETVFFDGSRSRAGRARIRKSPRFARRADVEHRGARSGGGGGWKKKRGLLIPAEACAFNRELLDHHLDELDHVIGPRMLTGRTLNAPDYFALLRRYAELQEQVQWTLRDVDALIVPTTMAPAWPLAKIDATAESYLDYNKRVHRNTGIGNLLNLCAVSVPCGFTSGGLPIGLMIYAKPFHEDHGAESGLRVRAGDRLAHATPRPEVDGNRSLSIGGRWRKVAPTAPAREACCDGKSGPRRCTNPAHRAARHPFRRTRWRDCPRT